MGLQRRRKVGEGVSLTVPLPGGEVRFEMKVEEQGGLLKPSIVNITPAELQVVLIQGTTKVRGGLQISDGGTEICFIPLSCRKRSGGRQLTFDFLQLELIPYRGGERVFRFNLPLTGTDVVELEVRDI